MGASTIHDPSAAGLYASSITPFSTPYSTIFLRLHYPTFSNAIMCVWYGI